MRRPTQWALLLLACLVLVAACQRARSDDAISTDIKAKMFSDPQLKDTGLQVAVGKGQVTLMGTVPSDAARLEAFKLATNTPGVSKVNDQMTVQVAQAAAPARKPEPAPVHRHPARKARPKKLVAYDAPVEEPPPPTDPVALPEPAVPAVPAPAAAPAAPVAPAPPPPPQPKTAEIPAGTMLTIRMIDGIDSSVNRTGEIFKASLDAPVVVDNEVVITRGADVFVRLAEASSAGHVSGRSELQLELVKLEYQGKSYTLASGTYGVAGSSSGKRTAKTVGGGAVLGAIIGAVAGGGKGAAIGAGVGAGAGGVYTAAVKGKQVKVPSETRLDFRLEQPVIITYMPPYRAGKSNH